MDCSRRRLWLGNEKRDDDCIRGGFRVLVGGVVATKLSGESYEGTRVMIVGAGTMSKLLVKHLESKRCTEMTILNRTKPRAEALAEEFPNVNMKIHLMEDFIPLAAEHDTFLPRVVPWNRSSRRSTWTPCQWQLIR